MYNNIYKNSVLVLILLCSNVYGLRVNDHVYEYSICMLIMAVWHILVHVRAGLCQAINFMERGQCVSNHAANWESVLPHIPSVRNLITLTPDVILLLPTNWHVMKQWKIFCGKPNCSVELAMFRLDVCDQISLIIFIRTSWLIKFKQDGRKTQISYDIFSLCWFFSVYQSCCHKL